MKREKANEKRGVVQNRNTKCRNENLTGMFTTPPGKMKRRKRKKNGRRKEGKEKKKILKKGRKKGEKKGGKEEGKRRDIFDS